MSTAETHARQMATYAKAQTPQLTDLQPGSIFRSLLEALAQELELVTITAQEATLAAIQESAYRLWGFDRLPAAAASGVVRLTAVQVVAVAIPIPSGTQVRVPGTDKVYRTLTATTFPAGIAGSTLDVLVTAIGAGVIFNTASATIREFVAPPSPALTVSNPVGLNNGRDQETDDERLIRFASYVRSLQRATAESIVYAAEQAVVRSAGLVVERVTRASVSDLAPGVARCVIANGTTQAASADLIAAANIAVQATKAAGVTVQTQAATITTQAITVGVLLQPSVTLAMVQATIESELLNRIRDLPIGGVLYVEQIDAAILTVPGVTTVVRTTPTANVNPGEQGIVVPGVITITSL